MRVLMRIAFFFIVGLAGTHAHAIEYNSVQPGISSLGFTFTQMNVPVEGIFGKFSVQLAFDPAKPADGKVLVEIDLNSIDVGNADGNTEVRRKNWFDTKNFPTTQFISSGIRQLGGNQYEASGKLTLKGRIKDVKAPFTVRQEGASARIEGSLTIKRLEWGIGEGIWSDTNTVADEVHIRFRFISSAKSK